MISFVVPTTSEPEGLETASGLISVFGESCTLVVVVVDGFGEVSESLVDKIEVIRLKDLEGSYKARNIGAQRCSDEWIGFVDSGVQVTLKSSAALILERNRGYAFSGDVIFNKPAEDVPELWYENNAFVMQHYLTSLGFIPTIFLVLPLEVFKAVSGFDERFLSSGDVNFSRDIAKYIPLSISDDLSIVTDLRSKKSIYRKIKRQVYGQCYLECASKSKLGYLNYIVKRILVNLIGLSGHRESQGSCLDKMRYEAFNYRICLIKVSCLLRCITFDLNKIADKMYCANTAEVAGSEC